MEDIYINENKYDDEIVFITEEVILLNGELINCDSESKIY